MACVSRKKVLIGCTGSVATIKLPLLIEKLCHSNLEIRVVVTEKAKHFLKEADLPPGIQVLSDTVEWAAWQDRGDPVLHIDLVKWADLFLIAPLDANTLGKISSGICDNILTCVARAWDRSCKTFGFLSCYEHKNVGTPCYCTTGINHH